MSTASRFTVEKRERLLAFTEAGWPVERACAASRMSRQTVAAWLARGRAQPDCEAGEFAARFDAARAAAEVGVVVASDPELPEDDPWRWVLDGDPFVALEPMLMARLTPEQQREAVRVSQVHVCGVGARELRARRNGAAR